MAKRISLGMARAAEASRVPVAAPIGVSTAPPAVAKPAPAASSDLKNTTISLPAETLRLLTRVAVARQEAEGGRKSVSGVIEWLARQHWSELEAEARAYAQSLNS